MKLAVAPSSSISGQVTLQPSKLSTQLACAVAILSRKKCTIRNPLKVRDTQPMLRALELFGGEVSKAKDKWVLTAPEELKPSSGFVDAKNSGSALAMLAGVLSAAKTSVVLTGDSNLRSRPMPDLLKGLGRMGLDITSTKHNDAPPFIIFGGKISGGEIKIAKGEVKYISAMLPPAPYSEKKSVFSIPDGSSEVFLDPVKEVMEAAGADLSKKGKKVTVPQGGYRSFSYEVRQDIADNAHLILPLLLAGQEVKLRVKKVSPRDKAFLEAIENFGIKSGKKGSKLELWSGKLRGATLDLSWAPELLPFIVAVGCMAKGKSTITNAEGARNMKSDRINAMAQETKKLGAKVLEQSGGLLIQGPAQFQGGEVDGHGDYAVTAALSIAGLFAKEKVVIKNGPDALRAAYPQFLQSFRGVGAEIGYQAG